MLILNLPTYDAKISYSDGKQFIFDPIRQKKLILTPEEWVRQHFVNYLITDKKYPKELIANEVSISLNGLSKRCDTIVYNQYIEPIVIIEYKAPLISIGEAVFRQILRYNFKLRVSYLIVSNGLVHYCCKIDYDNQTFAYLQEIPSYNEL